MTKPQEQTLPERRRARRLALALRCWISDHQHLLYAPVVNICQHGLAISGICPFQPGQEVSLRIEATGEIELVARSQVVWTRSPQEPTGGGMGIEFLEISAGAHLLDRLLSAAEDWEEGHQDQQA